MEIILYAHSSGMQKYPTQFFLVLANTYIACSNRGCIGGNCYLDEDEGYDQHTDHDQEDESTGTACDSNMTERGVGEINEYKFCLLASSRKI